MPRTYKFKLEDDYYSSDIGIRVNSDIDLVSGGFRCATLFATGVLKIYKGYTWDGCTPLINVFDLFTFGTPDGRIDTDTMKPMTYYASLEHDVKYQFSGKIGHLITRKIADRQFLSMMENVKFAPRYIYYIAVRLLGWTGWNSKK